MNKTKLLKELYEKYSGQMFAICLRYCKDRDAAQDVLHDGFIQIYNSLDKFTDRGEGSIRAWMSKVMVNNCLQSLRKKDLLKESENIDTNYDVIGEDSFSNQEINEIPKKVLFDIIASLPVGYRTVFNLYVFEEKSHKEIAELLGINEKSSSSQLYRAKSLISQKIKEYEKNKR